MKCPFCEFDESKVIDSRPTDEGEAIRRRRECLSCGKRFTTYEKIETIPLMVVNKVFDSYFKKVDFKIITFDELKKIVK